MGTDTFGKSLHSSAQYGVAFGRRLVDSVLMKNVPLEATDTNRLAPALGSQDGLCRA